MTDEAFQEYLDTRFVPALAYYDKRAIHNRRAHHVLSVYVIVVSAVVAVIAPMVGFIPTLFASLLAPSIPAAAGILALFQFQQHWVSYRAVWDALKREPSFRLARLDEYGTAADSNSLFVRRVEALLASEGREWSRRNQSVDVDSDGRESTASPSRECQLGGYGDMESDDNRQQE